jgi:LPPG:FO 2-phospho-L-lactate transferase
MYLALAGGVGGAKLAAGLADVLPADELVVIVNTGDDFEHLGLHISPDLDSVMYGLAGINNPQTGWGQKDETWSFMGALERLGSETWFRLGDRDLATHIERTRRLRAGQTLSIATTALCEALAIPCTVAPMSDNEVRTMVFTEDQCMDFQTYFVRERCEPKLKCVRFEGADQASPSKAFRQALTSETLRGIVVCPSNPFVSIDPILSLRGVREILERLRVPVVAVSPIVAGAAIKGPAAKMFAELQGVSPSVEAVAMHYGDLLTGIVIDERDADRELELKRLGLEVFCTDTIMTNRDSRAALAKKVIKFIDNSD